MCRSTAAVLLVLAALPHVACRKYRERGALQVGIEHALAAATMGKLCDAYAKAEKEIPDPARAYHDVEEHYTTLWPPLRTMRAGVEGVDPAIRYSMWLRFARNDYAVAGWSCPALDRLLLHEIDQRVKANPPAPAPSKFRRAIVRVAGSGEVSIDDDVVPLVSVRDAIGRLEEQSPPVFMDLYREGWPRKMHPNADAVIDDLASQPFSFAVCTQPDCRH